MKVKELIEQLNKYPQDQEVCFMIKLEDKSGQYFNLECDGTITEEEQVVYITSADFNQLVSNGIDGVL